MTDIGSMLLFAVALLVAIAALCVGRAIDTRSLRGRSLWAGRRSVCSGLR